MKTLNLTIQPRAPRLWQVAGLTHSHGMAVFGQIREGLDGKVARLITDWAKITQRDLSEMSGISLMAFSRRAKTQFSAEQSEQLVRIIRVIDRTVELFEGDKEKALKWLNLPSKVLRGKAPKELLVSETGAYEVMKLIIRLEHGVYS
ncbi:MAG TPA: antitoxin Xre/MbcA/ParS toxin-binding domain-containing protein [Scandinavium sp.]|jgi:putative toxin-antitoxin system antitoxin component (TIGR02293 family)